jgi:hypothetical protein
VDLVVGVALHDANDAEKFLYKQYDKVDISTALALDIRVISGSVLVVNPADDYTISSIYITADPDGLGNMAEITDVVQGQNVWELVVPMNYERGTFNLSVIIQDAVGEEKWLEKYYENVSVRSNISMDAQIISGFINVTIPSSGYNLGITMITVGDAGDDIILEELEPGLKTPWHILTDNTLREADVSTSIQLLNDFGQEVWFPKLLGRPALSSSIEITMPIVAVSGLTDLRGRIVVWSGDYNTVGISGETFFGQIAENSSSSFVYSPGTLRVVKESDGSLVMNIPDSGINENGEFSFVPPPFDVRVICDWVDRSTLPNAES